MSRNLHGAVVTVVGASGQLGRRIASQLSAEGAQLLLVGRSRDRLAEVGSAPQVIGDLTDAGLARAVAAAAEQHYGRLDGVVNAAGAVAFGPLAEAPEEIIEEIFLVDVVGPLWLVGGLLPALRQTRGFVVTMSGVIAAAPMAGMVSYSAAKAGLAAGMDALARELRRDGVSVIDTQPPHTETGLSQRALHGTPPRLGAGADPDLVAARIVQAIKDDRGPVRAEDFTP